MGFKPKDGVGAARCGVVGLKPIVVVVVLDGSVDIPGAVVGVLGSFFKLDAMKWFSTIVDV
jgi:hypothetical protein